MNSIRVLFAWLLLSLWAARPLLAQVELPRPNWNLADARAAAVTGVSDDALKSLFERARIGRGQETLAALQQIAADHRLPLPARERILHDFARGLGDLPPGSVGVDALRYLLDYQGRTLVPHPDNGRVGTPLYAIRAATAGSMNEWERQAGYDTARGRFSQDADDASDAFLADYRAATAPRRRGLLQALPLASANQLHNLASKSLRAPPVEPWLTPLAGQAALLLGDGALLQAALVAGGGTEQASLLREAAVTLDEPERIALLSDLIHQAPPVTATLAIAGLAPGLLHLPEVAGRLFGLLDDPALGSAAALALSASDRPEVASRLRELAATGEGMASRRAAIALETRAQAQPGGAR